MLPGEEQIEQAREDLAGPSVKLMRTVAQAIKEDLGAVKDVLDIFVRTGMQDIGKLEPQLEMLKKISDTLGVLGLEKARNQIQHETKELDRDHRGRTRSGTPRCSRRSPRRCWTWRTLSIASSCARCYPATARRHAAESEDDTQHRHVTQAVMGECIVNLAKIKESVIQLVDRPGDVRALDQVKPLLRGIVAGLLMLNKTKAVKVVERVGEVIATRLAPSTITLKPEHLERLADAIVSVEYYMETVSAGRSDPWYMLDNAERCLDLLETLPAARAGASGGDRKPARSPSRRSLCRAAPPSVMEVDEERSDPELLEIFIEEAKEEIANIQRFLPQWTENIANSEALISVRRSFHTLKGSGRMVGAQLLGEFAWNIENLLNRLINQTLEPSPPMIAFISEATKALPQLLEQLEVGLAPTVDVQLLMKQAEAFAEGDPEAESLTSQSLRVAVLPDVGGARSPGHGSRAFRHLRQGDARASRSDSQISGVAETLPEGPTIEEPLFRACHTLLGSARMAGFEPAVALAGPLAEHFRRHYEAGSGLTRAGLTALHGAAVRDRENGSPSRRQRGVSPSRRFAPLARCARRTARRRGSGRA